MKRSGDATPSAGDSTEPYDDAPEVAAPASSALPLPSEAGPGRYVVLAEHGRGGIGRILRARDHVLGRTVAIKELLSPSEQGEARFLREARITARLEHPSVVPVHDAGRWPDTRRPFYAMKLVSGRSLRELVDAASGLGERIALVPNVLAVAEAVAYAHSQRIIHRDLKPANVIVGAYGETVVIDWGLAKDLAEADLHEVGAPPFRSSAAPELTAEGAILGTPIFMPPEQAHGAEVDERADVYSLGALLYYVLSGQPPHAEEKPSLLLAQVRTQSPVPIREREPRVPVDLAAIVDKAMAWDAAGRYRDAGGLAADLRRFTTGQLVGAHVYSRRQLAARWIRRNRALTAITASFALASVLGAGWFLQREQGLRRDAESARDRAQAERRRADGQTVALLEQNGRRELDLGRPFRAAVYLAEAYRRAPRSPVIRSLVSQAVAPLGAHRLSLPHPGNVVSVAWSREGGRIATGGEDTTVRLWDARTGAAVHVLRGHDKGIEDVVFSPDGALVASVGAGDATIVWDAATGAELRRIPGGGFRASFSLDGARLAIGGKDGRLSVWDLGTGDAVLDTAPHKDRLAAIAFHPDGERAFTGAWDGGMTLWDASTWRRIVELPPLNNLVVEASFSSDGRYLLTCDGDVTLQVRHADSGRIVHTILLPEGTRFKNAWFAPDGRMLLTTSSDGTIRVWHTGSAALLRSLDVVPHGKLFDAALSPDGAQVATGKYDGADVWDVSDPSRVLAAGERGEYISSGFYPGVFTGDGARFVAGHSSDVGNEIRVWDARSGEMVATWPDIGSPYALATNVDGSRILTSGTDKLAPRLWDASGRLVARLEGHEGIVFAVAAARDGTLFATAGYDRTVRFWRADSGLATGSILRFEHRPTSVAFSPDARRIAVADEKGRVVVLRRDTGAELLSFQGHPTWIQDIEYSRDGAMLVTAGRQDHTASTWDALTGEKRRDFVGHVDNLTRASLGPDGAVVVTASVDNTARLWDERTGQLLRVLRGPTYSAEIAADGAHLFTTGLKELAVIWDIGPDRRSPAEIAAFVAARSPWRLRDGRLELAPRDPR